MTVRDNVIELRKIRHADTLVERIIHGAAAEIERLRKERDSARRMYCSEVARIGISPASVAEGLGWDLTQEESNG